jgi:BioD-like phosphotransacetylase family protein
LEEFGMENIYFVSEEEYSGVSAVVIGFALALKKRGFKLGYMRPVGYLPTRVGKVMTDVDASFMWKLLDMKEPLECAAPVLLTSEIIEAGLRDKPVDAQKLARDAHAKVSAGKDVFLLEGPLCIHQGHFLNLSGFQVAEVFNAHVVLVEKFDETNTIDKILTAKMCFKDRLDSVIINMIPEGKMEWVQKSAVPFLKKKGIKVLGAIPFVNILRSTSVSALAEAIGGRIMCAHKKVGNLVENVIVGAMNAEHALNLFRSRVNVAVVTGGDRSDIQIAAIEAGVKCLILTGNLQPSSVVLGESDERGIPMISVQSDTLTAATQADWTVGHARTHEPDKMDRLTKLIEDNVSFGDFLRTAGLSKK